MDYRDERDALRGRVENLEQELSEAKAQQSGDQAARVAHLEKQLADAQVQLQEVRRELLKVRETPPGAKPQSNDGAPPPDAEPSRAVTLVLRLVGFSVYAALATGFFTGGFRHCNCAAAARPVAPVQTVAFRVDFDMSELSVPIDP